MGLFNFFQSKSEDPKLDFVFESTYHLRYEKGSSSPKNSGQAMRAVKVEPNVEGCKGYNIKKGVGFIVTIFNMEGEHPIWKNNVQVTPKPMKVISRTADKVVLRGYPVQAMSPFGWVDFDGSDFGITVCLKGETVDKCIFHLHDRNVDIEYRKG